MGDENNSDTVHLDLNLVPVPEHGSGSVVPGDPVNLDEWIENPRRLSEAARLRPRHRFRWRLPPGAHNVPMEIEPLVINNNSNGPTLQAGEGSAPAADRANETPKTCENNTGFGDDVETEKQDDVEKGSGTDGSFFDCNICFDLAREPVVTCCGHLFCWPCLYQWIHIHSDVKECPVCKGEVTDKNLTPIYGRGSNNRAPEVELSLNIPMRPKACRVESLRQALQRTTYNSPVEEMIRRLGNRFDLTRDLMHAHDSDDTRETVGRSNSLISRLMSTRAIRRGQNPAPTTNEAADFAPSSAASIEAREERRLQSFLFRSQSYRNRTLSSLSSALTSAERLSERLFEAYVHSHAHTVGRNEQQPPLVDDRDSFSSIAAVINSESQMDTNVEIDSMGSLSTSTSTSRRRNDPSRVSDVDSGDSRAPRRRRLD